MMSSRRSTAPHDFVASLVRLRLRKNRMRHRVRSDLNTFMGQPGDLLFSHHQAGVRGGADALGQLFRALLTHLPRQVFPLVDNLLRGAYPFRGTGQRKLPQPKVGEIEFLGCGAAGFENHIVEHAPAIKVGGRDEHGGRESRSRRIGSATVKLLA